MSVYHLPELRLSILFNCLSTNLGADFHCPCDLLFASGKLYQFNACSVQGLVSVCCCFSVLCSFSFALSIAVAIGANCDVLTRPVLILVSSGSVVAGVDMCKCTSALAAVKSILVAKKFPKPKLRELLWETR